MDEIIQKLNESFCTILKIDECGNDENFLELGGGSFEFTKLQMQIKKSLGKKISLKELYRCGTVNGIAALIGGGQSDDEVVHVTDMQKTVYIGRRKEVTLGGSASKAYFELACDDYDTDRFRDTVTKIVNSQVSLRAAYVDEGKCIIRNQVSVEVPEYDLRGLSDDERAARLGENRAKQYEHEFDPAAPPLIAFSVSRTTDTSAIIHVSYDGLVSDGEGLDILIHEIDAVYGGKEPSVPCRFADYCSYLSDVKSSEDFEDDRRFWAEMVKNISHRPRLPIMKRPEKVEKASAVQIVKYFDESEYAAVSELARKNNITPFALLLTVFGKVLSLYSENHSFFINIPMSVRPEECRNIENTVGLCSNFTFVHFDDTKDLPLIETAAATQETLFDCREHSSFSGTDILKLFQERIGASIPAPVTFTSTVGSSRHGELTHFSKHYVRTFTSQNWIEVLLTEMDGSKVFLMNYEPDIISARSAEGIADCFMETVSRIASDESYAVTLRDIGVCSRDMSIIAETALLYDKDAENAEEKMWIGAELINAFKSYPDRKAIVSEEGEYTYGELRAAAESFISVLVSRCGHKPARIALVMDKAPEQIIVSAACMCAGISYMPLETELPEETQIKCIDNVNAEAVVVLGEHLAGIDSDRYNVIRCDSSVFTGSPDTTGFADSCAPDSEAVIINTSGTTGVPKSVSVLNRGLSNCIFNNRRIMGMDYIPTALAVTSLCHDMSLYDVYGILTAGGCIAVPSEKKKKEPSHWYDLIMRYDVNFWNSVPAFMEMLTLLGDKGSSAVAKLRTIVMGGDWISPALVKKLFDASPDTDIFSVGGPTETTIWNISHKVSPDEAGAAFIPYGKPFPATSYYILNSHRALCPIGVSGTMYVSGAGVTGGYIGDPDETELRYSEYRGARAYNTGDRGEYLENGEIRILGREDYQVKINGKRIELTGVENAVRSYDPISSCIVIKDEDTDKLIAVYTSDKEIDEAELKRSLSEMLQAYMIPQRYFRIEEFPTTRNGKIDRRKTALLIKSGATAEAAPAAASEADETTQSGSLTERFIAACREIFGDDSITAEDDFYGIGGDSIAAMKIAAWAKETYDAEIQVFDILNAEDLAEIAALIEGNV